jgi:hypothetical protein
MHAVVIQTVVIQASVIQTVTIQMIEVAFESIDVSGPEPAELTKPGIQLLKWFRGQPVETALCVHLGLHEPGIAQHSQVL